MAGGPRGPRVTAEEALPGVIEHKYLCIREGRPEALACSLRPLRHCLRRVDPDRLCSLAAGGAAPLRSLLAREFLGRTRASRHVGAQPYVPCRVVYASECCVSLNIYAVYIQTSCMLHANRLMHTYYIYIHISMHTEAHPHVHTSVYIYAYI